MSQPVRFPAAVISRKSPVMMALAFSTQTTETLRDTFYETFTVTSLKVKFALPYIRQHTDYALLCHIRGDPPKLPLTPTPPVIY